MTVNVSQPSHVSKKNGKAKTLHIIGVLVNYSHYLKKLKTTYTTLKKVASSLHFKQLSLYKTPKPTYIIKKIAKFILMFPRKRKYYTERKGYPDIYNIYSFYFPSTEILYKTPILYSIVTFFYLSY